MNDVSEIQEFLRNKGERLLNNGIVIWRCGMLSMGGQIQDVR